MKLVNILESHVEELTALEALNVGACILPNYMAGLMVNDWVLQMACREKVF